MLSLGSRGWRRAVFKRSGLTTSDLHRFVPRVLTAPGVASGRPAAATVRLTAAIPM